VRARLLALWDWFWHPPGLHAHRWRALATWVVVFTLVTAYGLRAQHDESHRNDTRFCRVTRAFITADLKLQNAQGAQTLRTIGLRQELIGANRVMRGVLGKLPPSSQQPAAKFLRAWAAYLTAEQALNLSVVSSSQMVQAARNKASADVRTLRRELRCAD
jgi:hypothetical protein